MATQDSASHQTPQPAWRDEPLEIPLPSCRTITLEHPKSPLTPLIVETLSHETEIGVLLSFLAAVWVTKINGTPVDMPQTRGQMLQRLQELGGDGVTAAVEGLLEHWPDAFADAESLERRRRALERHREAHGMGCRHCHGLERWVDTLDGFTAVASENQVGFCPYECASCNRFLLVVDPGLLARCGAADLCDPNEILDALVQHIWDQVPWRRLLEEARRRGAARDNIEPLFGGEPL